MLSIVCLSRKPRISLIYHSIIYIYSNNFLFKYKIYIPKTATWLRTAMHINEYIYTPSTIDTTVYIHRHFSKWQAQLNQNFAWSDYTAGKDKSKSGQQEKSKIFLNGVVL